MNTLEELRELIKKTERRLKLVQLQIAHYSSIMQQETDIASRINDRLLDICTSLEVFETDEDRIQKRILSCVATNDNNGALAGKKELIQLTFNVRKLVNQQTAMDGMKKAAEQEARSLVRQQKKADTTYWQLYSDLTKVYTAESLCAIISSLLDAKPRLQTHALGISQTKPPATMTMITLEDLMKRINKAEKGLKVVQILATYYHDTMQRQMITAHILSDKISGISATLGAFGADLDQIHHRNLSCIANKEDGVAIAEKNKLVRLTLNFWKLMRQRTAIDDRKKAPDRQAERFKGERDKAETTYWRLLADLNKIRDSTIHVERWGLLEQS
ncbi:hypothetical protein M407DRAFT_3244 [Tulasnella calospora MUT 4182]|uniref:Uncharacterized protein n=1 Tax=Tulasnella calospora MUT 4182 TaxID=1051891 RepID=A0A0C3QYW9_9AGAM|nr:hypothetical protein M407DRAFT_3244 [Tulasnella calospora MUT 4182]